MTINTISPDEKDQVKINGVIRRLVEIENAGGGGGGVGGGSGGGDGVGSGRLTLQTLTPIMTTAQSAKTTIYYTPYRGVTINLYDGANFTATAFTELSSATSDTTKSPAAIGVSKVNDWFVWMDGSTPTLSHGPDWSSDTTRSAGTALVMVNGVLLNNALITNGPAASRGTYVGTTRSNGSSQLDWNLGSSAAGGGAALLNVWNTYNRRCVRPVVQDSNTSWTYSGPGVRSADNSTGNRISAVCGLQEDFVEATYYAYGQISLAVNTAFVYIGLNSTSAQASTSNAAVEYNSTGDLVAGTVASYVGVPLGFNYFQALEDAVTVGSPVTFFGASRSMLTGTFWA